MPKFHIARVTNNTYYGTDCVFFPVNYLRFSLSLQLHRRKRERMSDLTKSLLCDRTLILINFIYQKECVRVEQK